MLFFCMNTDEHHPKQMVSMFLKPSSLRHRVVLGFAGQDLSGHVYLWIPLS